MQKAAHANLIYVPAGDRSLHPEWLEGPCPPNFDLAVNYYGPTTDKWRPTATFYQHSPGAMKFPAAADWLEEHWSLVSQYEYVALPDDDVSAGAHDWGAVFDLVRQFGLDLAQPSLTAECYWSHPITVQQAGCLARYTNFVEPMVPVFSLAALERCLPTFKMSSSGFGLDWVWPKLLLPAGMALGVIDAVAFVHTRSVTSGQASNSQDRTAQANNRHHPALWDEIFVKELFGLQVTPDPTTYSAVYPPGRPPAAPSGAPAVGVPSCA